MEAFMSGNQSTNFTLTHVSLKCRSAPIAPQGDRVISRCFQTVGTWAWLECHCPNPEHPNADLSSIEALYDMSIPLSHPFRKISSTQLQNLGEALWDWKLCGGCTGQATCNSEECPWGHRAKRLSNFWDLYKETMKLYKPEYFSRRRWALSSHEDLVEIIRWVREHPGTKLSQLSQDYYRLEDDEGDAPEKADQKRAFNLVATILAMVNCATSPYSSELLETGYVPTSWRDRVSISDFFKESFLQNFDGLVDNENETLKITGVLPKLSAPLLRKRAGLQFKPTCDLRDHLRLNSKEGIVHVFHLTAVLKEHLMAGEGTDAGGWTIPRPLALETLDTIHEVLFPPDEAAQEMLRSLVSHNGFDSDCQHFERARFQGRDDDEERSYQYWGRRLALLYAELEHPTPRGWLQTWLERRSGARYVLLATLIGAIVAVILGILSLGVAGLQAWIAWQQWKHTVSRR